MIYKDGKQERTDKLSKFQRGKYCYMSLLVELINELYATLEVLAILLNSMIQFKLKFWSQNISQIVILCNSFVIGWLFFLLPFCSH